MKKKVLALVCAMTLVASMSLSVCAAGRGSATSGGVANAGSGSPTSGGVANAGSGSSASGSAANTGSGSVTSGSISSDSASSSASYSNETLVTASSNTIGQVITEATLAYFAEDLKVTNVPGATVSAVSTDVAKKMIAEAQSIAGANTFIAGIIDLHYTGTATFTISCSNVWKGQNVTILHMKSDGSFEKIKPDSVEDNKVTFTMTSYSPIAIVIDTSTVSPKTGDLNVVIAAMAMISGLGTAVCGKKFKKQ